jgi:hypothetical protein
VTWLCAYKGARVNEITRPRACDVLEVDGIPRTCITPEAARDRRDRGEASGMLRLQRGVR